MIGLAVAALALKTRPGGVEIGVGLGVAARIHDRSAAHGHRRRAHGT